jgi:TolB-like protein
MDIHTQISSGNASRWGAPVDPHGVTETLTTDLSRISGLFVISRNTARNYKGRSIDIRQIGLELGARYVLEGSVQSAGNRVRISAQLIDAESGAHLRAERFDKPYADLLDTQDEVSARLCQTKRSRCLAMLESGHEQPVPIFQQLARSDPSGRNDVRAVPAVAAQR